MRPSDGFGRPRPVAAADPDAAATSHAGGTMAPIGSSAAAASGAGAAAASSIAASSGLGGTGVTTAPMMTYFLAEEADVDAALAAAGRDAESFKAVLQQARPLRGKAAAAAAAADAPAQAAPKAAAAPAPLPLPRSPRDNGDADDEDEHGLAGCERSSLARPRTPDASGRQSLTHLSHGQTNSQTHTQTHAHAHTLSAAPSSHPTAALSAVPTPAFSPMFSQSAATSVFGTPGPASLSAMSSPSSRRNSLSSSLMMDEPLGSGGGDETASRGPSFDMERGLGDGGLGLSSAAAVEPGSADSSSLGTGAGHMESSDPSTSTSAAAAASFLLSSSSAGLSTTNNSMLLDSGSAPQLIMPSIKMPSRRPFTELGKNMGRLKVLIAGDSGAGKTSLIKAIVQSCRHIVHVDHITPPPFSLGGSRRSSTATAPGTAGVAEGGQTTARARRRSSRSTRPDTSTSQITEIYASTKPYPAWWNELGDIRGLRRRKSLGDNVLDRNLCFVDTPGFSGNASTMDAIMPVVDYVKGYLQKLCSNALSDADFVGLVSGDGGTAVDVVFYMISGSLKPADVEFLRLLTPLTNVVPILARADALRTEKDVAEAKERVARQLHEANIQPFAFTAPTEARGFALTLASASGLPQPYAVSSANGSDHDNMDASLLMSPDYVQPLVPTDLSTLVEQVFCPDGVSRLRHAAARKAAQWRRSEFGAVASPASSGSHLPRPQSLYRPLSFGSGSGSGGENAPMGVLSGPGAGGMARPGVLTAPLGAPSSFALARIADHTQREEQLAQIRLATWAAELQRSLDSERARFEKLARSERAVWLTERLGECVQDGTLVAVPPAAQAVTRRQQQQQQQQQNKAKKKKRRSLWSSSSTVSAASSSALSVSASFSHEDPLGLLEVTAGLRARSLLVLELLSSLGMLGGMALWMAKHNYHVQVYEWVADEWTRLWNGEP